MNDYCDAVESHHECRSSEEMRAAFQQYNENTDEDTKKRCRVLSMDVSALSVGRFRSPEISVIGSMKLSKRQISSLLAPIVENCSAKNTR